MTEILSPYDIFDVAREIEMNGQVFYHKIAAQAPTAAGREFLEGLAEAEARHAALFQEMQRDYEAHAGQGTPFSPDPLTAQHIKAFASGKVFDLQADPTELVQESTPFAALLDKAIQLEKDTVIFYVGFREVMVTQAGQEAVDRLIRQEMGHIHTLSDFALTL